MCDEQYANISVVTETVLFVCFSPHFIVEIPKVRPFPFRHSLFQVFKVVFMKICAARGTGIDHLSAFTS